MSNDHHSADQRTAIYASTPADSMEPINDRLDMARNNAELIGLEVVAQYVDLRGENTQLLRMMEDATAHDPPFRNILVVNAQPRLRRFADDLEPHRARLAAHGVEIISASELAIRALGPAMEDYLREVHSEEVRRGIRAAAQQGFYAFANAPYGYRKVAVRDRGVRRYKLELDPPASETVRWIFDLRPRGSLPSRDCGGAQRPRRQTTWHQTPGTPDRCAASSATRSIAAPAWRRRRDMEDPDSAVRVVNAFPSIVTQQEFDLAQRMEGDAAAD